MYNYTVACLPECEIGEVGKEQPSHAPVPARSFFSKPQSACCTHVEHMQSCR